MSISTKDTRNSEEDPVEKLFRRDLVVQDSPDTSAALRQALGQAAWLNSFWLSAQQRKHPDVQLKLEGTAFLVGRKASTDSSSNNNTNTDWDKLLQTALKKIQVEDLGDLAANDLWLTIPEEDKDGRGRKDLGQLEKQLSVKVVFLEHDNHILLVGAKAKLEKKCLVIRNVLSHYYWRLKGKQINL